MKKRTELESLFEREAHKPSYFQVKSAAGRDVLDFCVPVNNWFPPPELSERIVANLPEILKYYPDEAAVNQDFLGRLTGLPTECIVPANGATELITQLCQHLTGPLITPIPTFGRWTDLPIERGAPHRFLQRERADGFRITVDRLVNAAKYARGACVAVCNPDNPTGVAMTLPEIVELTARLRSAELIVLDESFIDFADVGSAEELAVDSHNVVVVKSMGKALGWHGIRLGYAVASPALAARLRAMLPLWNVNGLASFVLKQLPDFSYERAASYAAMRADREAMQGRLSRIAGLRVYPSEATFLFCEVDAKLHDGPALRTLLLERHGILVRECSNKVGGHGNQFCFAVHHEQRVERLAACLEELMREQEATGRF